MTAHKKTPADLFQGDEEQVQLLLAQRQAMAEELHLCTNRAEAEGVLAPVFSAQEATQMALLKSLVRARDSDAADLLLAMHELAPGKAVRKEARRALIQLAGAKIYPSWTPEPEPAPAAIGVAVEQAPRFWKGVVAEVREMGEMQLNLCWEQGIEYGEVRMLSFLLDFWREGVKDFFTETGTRSYIERRLKEAQQATHMVESEEGEVPTTYVECTLAEGRRLLNDALDVNHWRKTEPHKDFRQALSLVQRLVLNATEVGEDRGLTFISRGLAPDMVVGNFAGGWSMGDYTLCYDLLTKGNPVLEGRTRDEWISMRRAWADEAHPARFEMYFLREREQQSQQSSLWLPTSVLSTRASSAKEVELGWSLTLTDTQLSGTLPEMPMGTAVYKETRRHWFWTIFSLEQEHGEWRIARIKDEGAAIQALPTEELEKRVKEHDEAIQKIMREHRPDEPNGQQYFDEILWRSWQILSLDDALLVRNPLDKALYESAYGRAMSLRAVERAAIYAGEIVSRFPADPDHVLAQQRLGAVQVALSERFASLGLYEEAGRFTDLGEATLRATLAEDDPLSYLLVSELLISQQKYDEAEKLLLEAREIAQEKDVQGQVEFDLANLAITRQRFPEAQQYLERLAEIMPTYPSLWAMLGFAQRKQNNLAEAEVSFKRSIEEEPTEVRAYSELGMLYVDQHKLNEARDILSLGLRNVPQSANLHALMAIVYAEKGDTRRAREYLNEAERINPELEIVQALHEAIKKK